MRESLRDIASRSFLVLKLVCKGFLDGRPDMLFIEIANCLQLLGFDPVASR